MGVGAGAGAGVGDGIGAVADKELNMLLPGWMLTKNLSRTEGGCRSWSTSGWSRSGGLSGSRSLSGSRDRSGSEQGA